MTKRLFMLWAMLLCFAGITRGQGCILDAILTNPGAAGTHVIGDTANLNLPSNNWTLYGSGLGPTASQTGTYNQATEGITQNGTFIDFNASGQLLTLSGGTSPTTGIQLISGNLQIGLMVNGGFATFWGATSNGSVWTVTTVGSQPISLPADYVEIDKRGNLYTGWLWQSGGWLNLGTWTSPNNWSSARGLVGLIAYSGDNINLAKATWASVLYVPVINGTPQSPVDFSLMDRDQGTVGVPGYGSITQGITISDTLNGTAQFYLKPVPPATTCNPNAVEYQYISHVTGMYFKSHIDIDPVDDVTTGGMNVYPSEVLGPTYQCLSGFNQTCTADMSVTNTFNVGDSMLPDLSYDQITTITLYVNWMYNGVPGSFSKVLTESSTGGTPVDSVKREATTTALIGAIQKTTYPRKWALLNKPQYYCSPGHYPPDYQPTSVREFLPLPSGYVPVISWNVGLCTSTPEFPGWGNGKGGPCTDLISEVSDILPPKDPIICPCSRHTVPPWFSYVPQ